MATEKEVIQIEVAGGDKVKEATGHVENIRKELTKAKAAALNGDGAAAKRVAELTDKMEDLKDETRSLQGSGVEKLKNSFGLLTDGFKNFDGGKIATAFKGIGSAMKAIPILLIVEGIRYMIENFDELSKGSGILATVLQGVGAVIDYVKGVINDFTDAIGATNTALDKQGEAIKGYSEKVNEALQTQIAGFDRQIAVAKASGKSTVELEKAKQQAIIDTNLLVARQIEAFVRAGGALDDEKKKLLTASLEAIKNAKVSEFTITAADNKAKEDQYKKHLEAKKALDAEFRQTQRDLDLQNERLKAQNLSDLQKQLIGQKKEDLEVELQQLQGIQEAFRVSDLQAKTEQAEKEKKLEQDKINNAYSLTSQGLQAAQSLSDGFFALKQQGANGDAKKELELRKKQFQVNKAFAISNAIMTGIMGVQSQLQAGPIIGPILAGIVGVTAALNVAKIASAKFDGGNIDTSGGGSGGTPALPQANTNVPVINQQQNNQPTTTFTGNNNNSFKPQPTKVFVTEEDMTKSQQRVTKLIEQSQF